MQQKRTPMTPRLLLMPIALALLCWASTARCNDLLQLMPGFAMTVQVTGADKGKFTAIIGDPTIADVTYGPQNTFMFIGKKDGVTNIIVLKDGDGTEMYNARIEVSSADTGQLRIYNKVLLTSHTIYKCIPGDCQYFKEVTASEPAKLPQGYLVQSTTTMKSSPTEATLKSTATSEPQ